MPEKRGAWTVCRFKVGVAEEEGVEFLRGADTPMLTFSYMVALYSQFSG